MLVGVILGRWYTGPRKAKEITMVEELPRPVENPLSGERVTFLATAEETDGEYMRIRNETSAGAQGVVMHYHLAYTEAFEVLEGALLDVCVGGKENHLVLAQGESVFVPPNTAHRFRNSSTSPVVFEVEIRPAPNSRNPSGHSWAWSRTADQRQGDPEEHPRACPALRAIRELRSGHAPVVAEGHLRGAGEGRPDGWATTPSSPGTPSPTAWRRRGRLLRGRAQEPWRR
jgi:quercetin dioxygenase-like cupin family protein